MAHVPVLSEAQCAALLRDYEPFTVGGPAHARRGRVIDGGQRYPAEVHPGHGFFHEFHSNQSGDPNSVVRCRSAGAYISCPQLLHALGHWRITPAFHDLVFHSAVTVCACMLFILPMRAGADGAADLRGSSGLQRALLARPAVCEATQRRRQCGVARALLSMRA